MRSLNTDTHTLLQTESKHRHAIWQAQKSSKEVAMEKCKSCLVRVEFRLAGYLTFAEQSEIAERGELRQMLAARTSFGCP